MRCFAAWHWAVLPWVLTRSAVAAAEIVEINSDGDTIEQCTWENREGCESGAYKDPNLKTMSLKFDGVDVNFDAYVQPDVATFYNETPGSVEAKETEFRGMFGKFINLSNRQLRVYWRPANRRQQPSYIADVTPFGAAGTATYPGHQFILTEVDDVSKVLATWSIAVQNSLYHYDPYGSVAEAEKVLSPQDLEHYKLQHRNLEFNRLYKDFTGRQWLALYGRKRAPRYPIWPADSIGQTHTVSTRETHIVSPPPDKFAKQKIVPFASSPEERDKLKPYRSPGETLALNMTVISVAPRAFEIPNFLSDEEVHHLLELTTGMNLARSTTRAGSIGIARTDDATRTSLNSWLSRERSPIVDAIFRRAADLLQMDEALFRYRKGKDKHLIPGKMNPIVERLQLVHYDVGQQYTPHHDFSIPDLKDGQASRFATILFYLNEGMEGGETSFPRWLNGNTTEVLKVKPEIGKAILFYNQLPDGNYDERSQHAALPVTKGEKWLTNLWVWDPFMA